MSGSTRMIHALVLTLIALVGGPGYTLLEGWAHATTSEPPHRRATHLEAYGAEDHWDRCGIALTSAPARAAFREPCVVRVPVAGRLPNWAGRELSHSSQPLRLPRQRGPPVGH